jgi:hypothetical protein
MKHTKLGQLGLILIFLFSTFSTIAQEVNWGPELQQTSRNYLDRIIGEDNKGIYVLKYRAKLLGNTMPVIEHYNKQMILKYSTPLKELSSFNMMVNNAWQFNNELYVFFSKYNARKGEQTLFYQQIDKATGKPAGKRGRITDVPALNKMDLGELKYAASTDSSRAVIYSSPTVTRGLLQKAKDMAFTIEVVDKDFNKVWDKFVQLPYKEDLFDMVKVEVDRDGNAYILARIYNGRRQNQRDGEVNFAYKILSYQNNGEKLVEYNLEMQDVFITDLTFKVNRNNLLTCAGFFSERKTNDSIKGTCFFNVDISSKEILSKKIVPFKEDFLAKLMNKRRAAKGKELFRYYLDEIILRSDGGAVLIGEQFYVVTNTYNAGTGINAVPTVTYTYHYEDVIIININPDGSVAWATNIPKDQQSSTTEFSSYAHMVVKGEIHFVYNSTISRRAPLMHAKVNTSGEVAIKELFNNKDEGILTKPILCKQTSKNEMVIYGERGKRFKFGKIEF